MPSEVQRLVLKSAPAAGKNCLYWYVGEQPAGLGALAYWEPVAGTHTIELRNHDGRVLDRINILVKGTPRRVRENSGPAARFPSSSVEQAPPGPEIAASPVD